MLKLYDIINTITFSQKPKTYWQAHLKTYALRMLERVEFCVGYEAEFEDVAELKQLLFDDSDCATWLEYIEVRNCEFRGEAIKDLDVFFYYQNIGTPEEIQAYEACGCLPYYGLSQITWEDLLLYLIEEAFALIEKACDPYYYTQYYRWLFDGRP